MFCDLKWFLGIGARPVRASLVFHLDGRESLVSTLARVLTDQNRKLKSLKTVMNNHPS